MFQLIISPCYHSKPFPFQSAIDRNREFFSADQNLGLVSQVSVSQTKTCIKRLTKTFMTLSLTELASRVGLGSAGEAEKMLTAMIEEGSINAKISQRDGKITLIISHFN